MTDYVNAYWHYSENFGDALTPYILQKLTGKNVVYVEQPSEIITFMVTGSMLDADITHSIVWGCGIAWENDIIKKPYRISAVRGPLSRKRVIECGWECPEVYGDPALILPRIYKPKSTVEYKLGIIPHYIDFDIANSRYQNLDGVKIINLFDPVEKVIDEIYSCEMTISSSLHGLVASQAYDKPNLWIEFSNNVIGDGTKFNDYFLSIGIKPYKPLNLREYMDHQEIINLIDLKYINIEPVVNKLLSVCPFLCDYPYSINL